jgi:hypothetical protein
MKTLALVVVLSSLLVPQLAVAQKCAGCPNRKEEAKPCHWLEVQSVVPDGPAAEAGILPGDALASYDGKPMGCMGELTAAQAAVQVDSLVASFRRGDRLMNFVLPKGKLGISFKEWMNDLPLEQDAKLIRGVPNLGWAEPNSFMGALEAIGHKLGSHVGYAFLCGVSGAAFRTHFFDTWCPSSVDATCGFDAGTEALSARGLVATWLEVSSDGKNKPQILDSIKKSIDAGMPVLAIDLIEVPEWGVIIGYQKDGEELLCRTYFDKHKGFEVARKFPFIVGILKRQGNPLDPNTSFKAGVKTVVANLTTEKYGEYYSGLAAFDKWIERLSKDDLAKLDTEKLANVVMANYEILSRLVADRKTALEYLEHIVAGREDLAPQMGDLSALYAQEVGLLEPLLAAVPAPGSLKKAADWSQERREVEAAALAEARALEAQALPKWQELVKAK